MKYYEYCETTISALHRERKPGFQIPRTDSLGRLLGSTWNVINGLFEKAWAFSLNSTFFSVTLSSLAEFLESLAIEVRFSLSYIKLFPKCNVHQSPQSSHYQEENITAINFSLLEWNTFTKLKNFKSITEK